MGTMFKVLILVAIIGLSHTTKIKFKNMCGIPSCKCRRHIDCDNYNEILSKDCATGTFRVNMTSMKEDILEKHNWFRNKVAGGLLSGFDTAARMGTVIWNDHLAQLASKNIILCDFMKDECRNTENFDFVGQSLGRYDYPKVSYHPKSMTLNIIDIWMSEHENCRMSYIETYPDATIDNRIIRHFTQIVRDAMTEIGCAAIMYVEDDRGFFEFVCNYSQTNLRSLPVYEIGPPVSGCKTGRNEKYPYLCSTNEEYVVNPPDAEVAYRI